MNKEKNSITLDVDLNADDAINKLEKIKQLLKDIKEIDSNFSLSNVLDIDKNSILVFNTETMLKQIDIERQEAELSNKTKYRCILLQRGMRLDKAINKAETIYYTDNVEIGREDR